MVCICYALDKPEVHATDRIAEHDVLMRDLAFTIPNQHGMIFIRIMGR
jgi:hypothetical protein